MSEAFSSNNLSGMSRFRRGHDVVMLLYLSAGLLGLVFIVAMRFTTDGWIALYLITGLTSIFGWIPSVPLIVIYRHSWRVVIPAAILVVCSGLFFCFDLQRGFFLHSDLTIGLVTIFYLSCFLIGIESLIHKTRRSRHS